MLIVSIQGMNRSLSVPVVGRKGDKLVVVGASLVGDRETHHPGRGEPVAEWI